MSEHTNRLQEIDRQQRQHDADSQIQESTTFAKPLVEALNTDAGKINTPLLPQESIDDQLPPRVNWTAVICTAIVAVTAAVILIVGKPWHDDSDDVMQAMIDSVPAENMNTAAAPAQEPSATTAVDPVPVQTDASSDKVQVDSTPQPVTVSDHEQKTPPVASTPQTSPAKDSIKEKQLNSRLPLLSVKSTGTQNKYNGTRLVDLSIRKLTSAEVAHLSAAEMNLARNAVYARHGYRFNNPELREFFDAQSWFKPTDVKIDAIPFTQTELDNIRLIKAQESTLQN